MWQGMAPNTTHDPSMSYMQTSQLDNLLCPQSPRGSTPHPPADPVDVHVAAPCDPVQGGSAGPLKTREHKHKKAARYSIHTHMTTVQVGPGVF